jgi:Cu+-exporting ATPase
VLGVIALGDTLRPDAKEAVAALRRTGLRTVLLTGDNERAARRIAQEVGIDDVHAGVLPDGKAELFGAYSAMGAGTDIAIESADIIILSNRLAALPIAREISRRSYCKMLQNVTLAFLFNGIGIPAAATGLVYPVWAMTAMAVSVTAIFFNSLWGRPRLFIDAILSVGRPAGQTT